MREIRQWWLLPLFLSLTMVVTAACGLVMVRCGPPSFDSWLLLWFRTRSDMGSLADPVWGTPFWLGVSSLGNTAPRLALASLSIFGLLLLRRRQSALFMTGVLLSGIVLSTTLKHLIGRPRPEVVTHLDQVSLGSFPSGHALNSILFYGLVALMLVQFLRHRTARWVLHAIAATLSLAIGLSRIALGVHYPSDVVAGWLIGASWLSLWVILAKRFWPKAFPTHSVKNNLWRA